MSLFSHDFLNLFLKTVFKLKNKKKFFKTCLENHDQIDH